MVSADKKLAGAVCPDEIDIVFLENFTGALAGIRMNHEDEFEC